ncbi:MAG TPA: glycosyltransferase family 2 protein [Solirubrobacteraceae bacterium]|nr:glycosyltransferase family 2 protein [Solirubrobacteraceae bacterium]
MNLPDSNTISVVISTYQRPEACERALRSALDQTEPPLEVLVCDDGSTDETEARMHDWERRDARVQYLRRPRNSGMPAVTRNLGIEHARGDWIAFLDDDDEWLPGKLAAQRAALALGGAEAISTNALRSDGSLFHVDAPPIGRPTRADLMWTCPIIMSSALVARDRLIAAGGFQTSARVRGVEDYALWLELTARGARLLTLGEPLVRYDDASVDRLSTARMHTQIAVARLNWAHLLRPPAELAGLKGALRHSAATVGVGMQTMSARALARLGASGR